MTELAAYLDAIKREFATGKTTEHSYRPALKTLLESVETGLTVVNEPKRIDAGAPDYIIERGDVPLGFVEAKDIDVDIANLRGSNREQHKRYLGALPNLIYTNYLHFRWYVGGDLREDFSLGEVKSGTVELNPDRLDDVAGMLHRFINTATPTVTRPRDLAERMASMAQQITILIKNSLPDSDVLQGQLDAFETTLIPNLSPDEFADMYAQTLAYGLFAARVEHNGKTDPFTLRNAFWELPETNPFLKQFFERIALQLDERVKFQVESLAQLLAQADMDAILHDFGRATRQQDPIVHFYETFLAEYDPTKREQRGVYYTPEPVVSYIVRSVNIVLRERFGRDDGLADKDTLILDPATGTGTFLYFVIKEIYEQIGRTMAGAWDGYARDHLLPRIFGFELLMAPYAVAHMKLGMQLRDTGYTFPKGNRLGIYLTNTLEDQVKQTPLPLGRFISEEANKAVDVKRTKPIMVVLGNPPYSGHSANRSRDSSGEFTWIGKLLQDYYQVDGKPLGERNPKWLQDDYVKFIRFGQWRINETQSGVLAFVTNNGYLDNPTFRGMRQQLMEAFSDIYILNLHGNSRKKETTPDGGKDENVFDIQQGVAIGIFVKDEKISEAAQIHYADIWGLRKNKYDALLSDDITQTGWQKLQPRAPFYLFVPYDIDMRKEYEQNWKVTDIFNEQSWGIATRKDYLLVGFTRESMVEKFEDIRSMTATEAKRRYEIKESPHWNFEQAHKLIPENVASSVKPILFRPLDIRYVYYEKFMIERGDHRYPLMFNMLSPNLSLITVRRSETSGIPQHFYCSDNLSVLHSTSSKEGNFVFPLYIYPDPEDVKLLEVEGDWQPGKGGRTPNLNPKFIEDMSAKLGLEFVSESAGATLTDKQFTPEDVFHYAYAVFHSPTYRERYAEFLKIDFPRLPLTSNVKLFRALCANGSALVDLHLARGSAFQDVRVEYSIKGANEVAKTGGYPKFTEPVDDTPGRVYINRTQYFEGIALETWDFQIGGYQVLHKWLKDRRGRVLSFDDIRHYTKIVRALDETQRLMSAIDDLIPGFPIE